MDNKINKTTRWEKFLKVKAVIELIAIVLGILILIRVPYEIRNLQDTQNKNAFDLMMNFDNQLNSDINLGIWRSINSESPLLKSNGGTLSDEQLNSFLNVYESIGSIFKKGLIKSDLLCDWYGDDFNTIISNKEITNYISELRKDDAQYYSNLESTENVLKKDKCLQ